MSTERYELHLSKDDTLDITLGKDRSGQVVHLVVNYRARFRETGDRWHEIYRVDTSHGYLHEQRYWKGPEPIPLKVGKQTLEQVFDGTIDMLKVEYWRYKQLYRKEKIKEDREKKN